MKNPFVTIDLRSNPLYISRGTDYFLLNKFKAEVLMWNFNRGTMRVRLYDYNTGKFIIGNLDTDDCYVVDDNIVLEQDKGK